MEYTPQHQWPEWLKNAKTENALVTIENGIVIWRGGDWHDGVWHDGDWHDGVWRDGVWHGGVWHGGVWCGGVWYSGVWYSGVWCGGVWRDGVWRDGVWRDNTINRIEYMTALSGVAFDGTYYIGYRVTRKDGYGLYNSRYKQKSGIVFEKNYELKGAGVCCAGLHINNAATAWNYFNHPKNDLQLWRVKVKPEHILDSDGQKVRIRGGIFQKVEKPF